jgi:hypothetical protein
MEYEPHRCLDFILPELRRFPGYGVTLLEAGLRSPVIRNRNLALRALDEWGKTQWPRGIESALKEALAKEPEQQVEQNIENVRAGKNFAYFRAAKVICVLFPFPRQS